VSTWTLTLESFAAPYGNGHVYARLDSDDTGAAVEVTDTLTEAWARALNETERWGGPDSPVEYDYTGDVGQPCERFATRADAIARAVVVFATTGADGDVLYLRSPAYVDRGEPLAVCGGANEPAASVRHISAEDLRDAAARVGREGPSPFPPAG
jgi:hypothetical protein